MKRAFLTLEIEGVLSERIWNNLKRHTPRQCLSPSRTQIDGLDREVEETLRQPILTDLSVG